VNIFLADEQDVPLSTEPLRQLAVTVMREEGLPDGSEVAIMFVADTQMAEYNERFMHREGPTDVLAFPLEHLQPGVPPSRMANAAPLNLGDIMISPSYVQRQAESQGVSFEAEIELMVAHGMLHLLGYDHQVDAEAEVMEARERELLAIAREAIA
jgi:probable rRNA maturation factor